MDICSPRILPAGGVWNGLWRYSTAVFSVSAGTVLRLLLAPILGTAVPYITMFPAVAFAAWVGGLGPGIQASPQEGRSYEVEFRVVHPNGDVHWVSTKALVFANENSAPARMLGATMDITPRNRRRRSG